MASVQLTPEVTHLPAVDGILRYPARWRFDTNMAPPDSPAVATETLSWLARFCLLTAKVADVDSQDHRHHAMAIANYGGASLPGADRITRLLYTEIITLWLSWDDVCVELQTPARYVGQESAELSEAHRSKIRAAWQRPTEAVVAPVTAPETLAALYDCYVLAWKDVLYRYYHHLRTQNTDIDLFWERFLDGLHKWLDTAIEERRLFALLQLQPNLDARRDILRHCSPAFRRGSVLARTAGPIWHVTPHVTPDETILQGLDMQRTITIGMYSTPQMVEASRSRILSEAEWYSDTHQQLLRLCGVLVGWPNELFGLGKDFGKGDDWGNLVSLRTMLSGDWERSFLTMVEIHNAAVEEFDRLAATLPIDMQEYVQHLRYCCSGFAWWHSTAPRYRRLSLVIAGKVLRPSVVFY